MPTHQKPSIKKQRSGTIREMVPEPLVFKKDKIYLTFIVLVFALANLNGLKAQLTFDDHNAVSNNKVTGNSTPWTDIFLHDFWGHRLTEITSNDSFRPLTVFTFKLQHFVLGRHSALFLRLFNYLLATVNVVLVYYTSRILSYLLISERDIPLVVKGDKIEDDHAKRLRTMLELIPLSTAALFAVHPVHVEAVTSIVGRSELICAALGFGAFILLHLYLQHQSNVKLIGALAALELSVFGKESGVTFGAMFVVYLVILFYLKRVNARQTAKSIVFLFAFVFVYVQFRKHFIGHVDLSQSPLIRRTENPQYFIPPGLLNWWSMRWVVLMKNLELSFFPTKLNCEYSFNCVPHMDSVKDARFIPFTCVTIFFALLGLTLLYRSIRRRSHVSFVFLLSLLWYGIPLSPVTHIFVKVGTFIAERCLYIPSFAAVYLVVAGLLFWGRNSVLRVRCIMALLICLAIWWTWLTVRRNEDWYDDESLFLSNMRTCPTSGKAHYQTGLAIAKRKGVVDEEARKLMETAITLDDDFFEPLIYLAFYDYEHNNYTAAYEKARVCVTHPITAQRCTNLYQALSKALFPDRKGYETFEDLAQSSVLASVGAKMYRMAGLSAIQEADKATAADLFHKSLTTWERATGMDPWMEAKENSREEKLGEDTYCNTFYWYAHTYKEAAVTASTRRVDGKSLLQFIHELVKGCERCRRRWRSGKVLSPKDPLIPSYQKCLADYNTVTTESLSALISIVALPNVTTAVKRAAQEAAVDISLMQLCNVAELADTESPHVTALKRLFPQSVSFIQRYFAENREDLLKRVRELIRQAKNVKPLDDQKRHHWSDLGSCSPFISEPLRQELQ